MPLLPAAGTAFTSLAVEDTSFEDFSQAWAVIGDEGASLSPAARYAMRSLSCAARCALTTLPAGKENDAKAAQLVSDLKAGIDIFLSAETREHKSKKKAEAEVCRYSMHACLHACLPACLSLSPYTSTARPLLDAYSRLCCICLLYTSPSPRD